MTPLLTTREAAAALGVTARRVRKLAKDGTLPATREETARGVILYFHAADVAAYSPGPAGWPKGKARKAVAADAAGKGG